MFRVGQRVWTLAYDWGTVTEVIPGEDCIYPVEVCFDKLKYIISFTTNGEESEGENRTLFFEEVTVPSECLKPKKWRAEQGERYWYFNEFLWVCHTNERFTKQDNATYILGNYFRTEEECEQMIEIIKNELKKHHYEFI